MTIYDTDGTTVVGTGVATGGAGPITTSALSEGAHTLTLKATDAAGNQGAASTAFHVTIDTMAPAAPSITSIPENGGGGIDASEASDGTPVVVGLTDTGAAAGDTLAINWGGQTVTYTLMAGDISGSSATVTVPTATIVAQGQGTFDVTATLTDAAGNASSNSTATSVTVNGIGGGSGDVHMITFDGLHYDFQAVGDFVAVQSTDPGNAWEVQIRTDSLPGAVSITTALGALIDDDRVTFAIGRDSVVHIDGAPDTGLHPGVVQTLEGGTLTQVSDDTYRLDWNTGELITVIDRGVCLDWTVELGPQDGPGSVRGLLGSNTGQANDDFQLHDGTVLTQPLSEDEILSVFADAWSVTPGTSLLDGLDGRPSTGTASYASALAGVTVNLHLTGPQETFGAGVDWLKNIENLTGSSFDDTLTGSGHGSVISGGAGNDILSDGVGSIWVGEVYRLYGATLDRQPDPGGLEGWDAYLEGGASLVQTAGGFTGSQEFQTKYGTLDDTDFVTLLYHNVLDRDPDPDGLAGWLNLLETGTSRTSVVVGFSESPEYQTNTAASLGTYVQNYLQDLKTTGGVNVLDGGDGVNTASYASAMSGVTVDLGITGPQDTLGAGVDTLKNIENLVGSSFNDTFTGNASANIMTGGPGSDTFRYTAASQSTPAAYDTITDFTSGQDKIDLSALAGLGNGLAATATAPSTIDPHTLLAYVAGGNTILYANTTASTQAIAAADMEIHLTGVTALADTDILHHA